jgi:thiosulfate reductase cytochrome b subunit
LGFFESFFVLLLEEGELFLKVLLDFFAGERAVGHNVGWLLRTSNLFGFVQVGVCDQSLRRRFRDDRVRGELHN